MSKTPETQHPETDLERQYREFIPDRTDLLLRLFEAHQERRHRETLVRTVVTYGMHEKPIV